jgi:hypothetical protein
LRQYGERIFVGPVVHPEHDDGMCLWPEDLRIAAPLGGCRHPLHVAVQTFSDEAGETLLCLRDRVGARNADGVEALGARFAFERGLQFVNI